MIIQTFRWFRECSKLKLGNGEDLNFWTDCWCERRSLMEMFPQLFEISVNQNGAVAEFGDWFAGRWSWQMHWRRELTDEEVEAAAMLNEILTSIQPQAIDADDKLQWVLDSTPNYQVKSVYKFLISKSQVLSVDEEMKQAAKTIWLTAAPSKFLVHAWRVILDKIPTRKELEQRGILSFNCGPVCVLCNRFDEDCEHLFFTCRSSASVWLEIRQWLGMAGSDFYGVVEHMTNHAIQQGGKRNRRLRFLIWVAVVWVIWTNRNAVIFRGERLSLARMVSQVKRLTWSWFVSREGRSLDINYEDWDANPCNCIALLD